MNPDSYRQEVREILELIRDHSLKVRVQRTPGTTFDRWARWLTGGGLFILAACVVSNAVMANQGKFVKFALEAFLGMALLMWVAGTILLVIDLMRTIKRSFPDHVSRILESLPHEAELFTKLLRSNTDSLRMARDRLRLESAKVTSRLGLIGGEALKTSLVGIGVLSYALLMAYRKFDPAAVSLSDLTFLGLALVVGFGIGGWSAKFGMSLSDYYGDLLGIAIEERDRQEGRVVRRWSRALPQRHWRRSR